MNRHEPNNLQRPWDARCPHSDAVVALTVDGAIPSVDEAHRSESASAELDSGHLDGVTSEGVTSGGPGESETLSLQEALSHAATCPVCAEAVRESRRLDSLLTRLPVAAPPSDEMIDRWLQAAVGVDADMDADGVDAPPEHDAPPLAQDAPPLAQDAPPPAPEASPARGGRVLSMRLAAAALLVSGLVAVGVYAGRDRGRADGSGPGAEDSSSSVAAVGREESGSGASSSADLEAAGEIRPAGAEPDLASGGASPKAATESLPPFTQRVTRPRRGGSGAGAVARSAARRAFRRAPVAADWAEFLSDEGRLTFFAAFSVAVSKLRSSELPEVFRQRPENWIDDVRRAEEQFVECAVAGLVDAVARRPRGSELELLERLTAPGAARSLRIRQAVRDRSAVVAAVATRLRSVESTRSAPCCLRLAARLGGRTLDGSLRDAVVGGRLRVEQLTSLLEDAAPRAGRGRLLLESCAALARRGVAPELIANPRPLPGLDDGSVVAELVDRLERSRDAVERGVALRLLGSLADPAVSPELVAVLAGPSRPEAELAAWALGRLPVGADALADRLAPAGREAMVQAALLSRGDPRARAALGRLQLTEEERAFLEAGSFRPEQIPVAAALCARRTTRQ